ncbi:MAG: hypothetical protein AAF441_05215 [Pseudomonadota bacterium]
MRFAFLMAAAGTSLILSSTAAFAQEPGRFAMKDSGNGFVKLDTKTGIVTECKRVRRKWECAVLAETVPRQEETKPDPKKAEEDIRTKLLERDNIRLKSRVAELEVKLKKLEEEKSKELRLPDDKDLDKLMGFFEKLMERFMDFAKQAPGESGERT